MEEAGTYICNVLKTVFLARVYAFNGFASFFSFVDCRLWIQQCLSRKQCHTCSAIGAVPESASPQENCRWTSVCYRVRTKSSSVHWMCEGLMRCGAFCGRQFSFVCFGQLVFDNVPEVECRYVCVCGVATQSQTLVAEHKVKGVLHTPRLRAPNGNQPSLDTSVVVSAVCNKHDHILQQRAWGHCVVHALDDRSYQ